MGGTIYVDTRQQRGKHEIKHRWLERHGVEMIRKTLPYGDYMAPGSNISIDTKKGVQEICQNVTRDHERFVREIERATDAGYRLIILIEAGRPYLQLTDIALWENKRGKVQGPTLSKILLSMQLTHNVTFELCHPRGSAQRICDILGVPYDLKC